MKKKNLKSLKLNKQAISNFTFSGVRGGKKLAPTKELSCYDDQCFNVTSVDIDCNDVSVMYGSCDLSCNPNFIC